MTSSGDEQWVESITAGARNPINWYVRAGHLKRSADALFKKKQDLMPAWLNAHTAAMAIPIDDAAVEAFREIGDESMAYGAPAMMLLGFAIENYLKGLLVVRDPSVVRPPPRLFAWDHRLMVLAVQAKIQLTEKESELLDRLTIFTIWGGRYPAPMNPVDGKPNAEGQGPVHWSTDDLPVADDLVQRLGETLWAEILEKGKQPR